MSDFLHSIRNRSHNNDKSSYSHRPSRQYDNGNNYNRSHDRKYRPKQNDYNNMHDGTMTRIKEVLETIAASQEALIEVADRRALAEERKADAIEHIASLISGLANLEAFAGLENQVVENALEEEVALELEEEISVAKTAAKQPAVKEKKADKTSRDMSKEEIMDLIHKMRKKGKTYNEIAASLTEMELPTFSGRGKWHAQTIHRLCQQG